MIKDYRLILDKYSEIVFCYFLSELKNEHLAQELTQACFIKLWQNADTKLCESFCKPWLLCQAKELKELNQMN